MLMASSAVLWRRLHLARRPLDGVISGGLGINATTALQIPVLPTSTATLGRLCGGRLLSPSYGVIHAEWQGPVLR